MIPRHPPTDTAAGLVPFDAVGRPSSTMSSTSGSPRDVVPFDAVGAAVEHVVIDERLGSRRSGSNPVPRVQELHPEHTTAKWVRCQAGPPIRLMLPEQNGDSESDQDPFRRTPLHRPKGSRPTSAPIGTLCAPAANRAPGATPTSQKVRPTGGGDSRLTRPARKLARGARTRLGLARNASTVAEGVNSGLLIACSYLARNFSAPISRFLT
jgi:hypothetical protein